MYFRSFFLLTGKCWLIVFVIIIPFLMGFKVAAQVTQAPNDSIILQQFENKDSSVVDSLTLADDLKAKVKYDASDSIVYDLNNSKVFLFGKAKVDYKDIHLEADYIEINFSNKTLYSHGLTDSSGQIVGKPVFKQGGETFKAETISYNFDTKKGKIISITTQEGDSYIKGQEVKKQPDNTTFIKNGYYTTCNKEPPDYYIFSNKIK